MKYSPLKMDNSSGLADYHSPTDTLGKKISMDYGLPVTAQVIRPVDAALNTTWDASVATKRSSIRKRRLSESSISLESVDQKQCCSSMGNSLNGEGLIDCSKDCETNQSMSRMEQVFFKRRKNASKLWLEGNITEAVGEMCYAEAIGMKVGTLRRFRALSTAQKLSRENFSRPSKGKRVSFSVHGPQIIGHADPTVDRFPIPVSSPSKVEQLLIRAARTFPEPDFQRPLTCLR